MAVERPLQRRQRLLLMWYNECEMTVDELRNEEAVRGREREGENERGRVGEKWKSLRKWTVTLHSVSVCVTHTHFRITTMVSSVAHRSHSYKRLANALSTTSLLTDILSANEYYEYVHILLVNIVRSLFLIVCLRYLFKSCHKQNENI